MEEWSAGRSWLARRKLRILRSLPERDFFACSVALLTTGISFDGGYAEYMVAPRKRWRVCLTNWLLSMVRR